MGVEADAPADSLESAEGGSNARAIAIMIDQVLAGRAAHGHPQVR